MPLPSPTPPPPRRTSPAAKQWRCDICEEAFFADYADAVQHEAQCQANSKERRKRGRELQFQEAKDDMDDDDAMTIEEQEQQADDRREVLVDKPSAAQVKKELPNSSLPSSSLPSSSSSSPSSSSRGVVHPFFKNDKLKMGKGGAQASKSDSTKSTGDKSKQVAAAVVGSFFLPGGRPKHVGPKDDRATTTTTTGTVRTNTKKSNDKKRKQKSSNVEDTGSGTEAPATAPAAASQKGTFKMKKKKKTKQLELPGIITTTTTTAAAGKPPRPKTVKRKKGPPPPAAAAAGADDVMIGSEVMKATPSLASIFQSKSTTKEILAEQRTAEFQAKREAERQKEKVRQAKRAAAFGKGKSSSSSNGAAAAAAPAPAIGSSTTSSAGLKRKPAANHDHHHYHHRATATKHSLLPMAPRFPVPNHVVAGGGNHNTAHSDTKGRGTSIWVDGVWKRAALIGSHPSSTDECTPPPCPANTNTVVKWLSSPSALDATTHNPTMVQQALSETLLPPLISGGTSSMKSWSDKYGMEHGLVGSDAQGASYQQLVDNIHFWKAARGEALQRMAERQRKWQAKNSNGGTKGNKKKAGLKKKKKKTHHGYGGNDFIVDDDEDYELDADDDDLLSKLCLLIGPSSSGKTSLVHHVAQKCNCSVVEINSSSIRGGAALKRSIQEATQSASPVDAFQSKKAGTSSTFFTPTAKENVGVHKNNNDDDNELFDSDDDEDDSEKKRKLDELNKISLTIVLIDEVDILYDADGDSGFWAALTSVVKTSMCPIILTANQYPPQLFNSTQLPCHFIKTQRPSAMDCAKKVLQVCQHEGMEIQPHLRAQGAEATHEKLAWVAKVCDCDLRRMMFELQLFASAPKGRNGLSQSREDAMTNPNPGFTADEWRPVVLSLNPCNVPIDKYSVITVKGKNFSKLVAENVKGATAVWIGSNKCPHHVVSDESMLVLCPPHKEEELLIGQESNYSSRLVKRVVRFSLESMPLGIFKSTKASQVVVSETLVDGNLLSGSRRLSVMYEYPEHARPPQVTESEDEIDEECEFHDEQRDPSKKSQQYATDFKVENVERGEALWKEILSKIVPWAPPDTTMVVVSADHDMVDILERQSSNALKASDAAVLEDGMEGLPFLAGASRGFAFDYTQEYVGKTRPEMLRMRENSRPPGEEKLLELGWKDNCAFYGDPDAFVTLPTTPTCQREMNAVLNGFRGSVSVAGMLASESCRLDVDLDPNDVDCVEDLDRLAVQANAVSEEDRFLPYPVLPLMERLPEMLRMSMVGPSIAKEDPFFDQRRDKVLDRYMSCSNQILPHLSERTNWSYGRLGSFRTTVLGEKEVYGDFREVLELMPLLRRIGTLEKSADYAAMIAEQDQEALCRRSNRRSTRRTKRIRHHYLDRISVRLRRDEADLSSNEIGSQLSQALLKY